MVPPDVVDARSRGHDGQAIAIQRFPADTSISAMTYAEFWLVYLCAHRRPGTRLLHYVGTSAGVVLLIAAIITVQWWFAAAAVLVGYGLAWTGHVAIEGNRPATFGHPLWSLVSDLRMLALWASGRLTPHLVRAASDAPPAAV
jgi:hypothetical protein